MKTIIFVLTLLLFFNWGHATNCNGHLIFTTDTIPKKKTVNENEKLYCSDYAKSKYKILISGSKIKITRLYKEYVETFSGTIKNGKIYSNHTDEKTVKDIKGKYYKFQDGYFGVLNIENGDYEWFSLCKN